MKSCIHLDRRCVTWEACANRTAKDSATRYRESVRSLAEMVRLRLVLEAIRDGAGYGPDMADEALRTTPAHVVIPTMPMLAEMVAEAESVLTKGVSR